MTISDTTQALIDDLREMTADPGFSAEAKFGFRLAVTYALIHDGMYGVNEAAAYLDEQLAKTEA